MHCALWFVLSDDASWNPCTLLMLHFEHEQRFIVLRDCPVGMHGMHLQY